MTVCRVRDRALVRVAVIGAVLAVALGASAQPRGPADIIGGAARARDQRALTGSPAAAGAGTSTGTSTNTSTNTSTRTRTTTSTGVEAGAGTEAGAGAGAEAGAGAGAGAAGAPIRAEDPHSGVAGAPGLDSRPLAFAEPNAALPTGTIRVRVLDATERPVAGADVNLGILGAQGSRDKKAARTDASGVALFSGLPGGEGQAYRVNVPHKGATYAATPFRLPMGGGYEVVIRRLDTTTSTERMVMLGAAASIELSEERLKIVEQARLVNIGALTYVFPKSGTSVKLPTGFTAFQSEESMTDQRLVEVPGEGVRVEGSLAPGQATLLWGFDLPITGSEMRFALDVPWRGMGFRVIADAAPGVSLEVEGMPPAQLVSDGGRKFWITERQWRPGEQPMNMVHVTVRGIPGPGPMRWIAAGLAALLALLGAIFSGETQREQVTTTDHSARKQALLEQAAALDAQFRAGQIGPDYRTSELQQIEEALAALLWEEQRAQRKAATAARAGR